MLPASTTEDTPRPVPAPRVGLRQPRPSWRCGACALGIRESIPEGFRVSAVASGRRPVGCSAWPGTEARGSLACERPQPGRCRAVVSEPTTFPRSRRGAPPAAGRAEFRGCRSGGASLRAGPGSEVGVRGLRGREAPAAGRPACVCV